MQTSVTAFFPGKGFDYEQISDVKDPNWMMMVPLVFLVIIIVYLGVNAQSLIDFFEVVAGL